MTKAKERIDQGRTDAQALAMIRDLSGETAYDLMVTFDIDEPTDLSDGGIRETLIGAYLDGDLPHEAIVEAWKDEGERRVGLSALSAAMAPLARKAASK